MKVAALWRYPVKSLQGESLASAEIDRHGILGDRQWALVDVVTGMTLTARRQPELLFAAATLDGDGVRITLPDGSSPRDDADLSDWLGHPVRLDAAGQRGGLFESPVDPEHEDGDWVRWRGPGGSFHDSPRTQLSLVSIATMRGWDVRRFRPNVVLDDDGDDALVGTPIGIGSAELVVLKQIDRCVVVTRPQPGLERDLDVIRTINRERATYLGIGAVVTAPGRIATGDEIRRLSAP